MVTDEQIALIHENILLSGYVLQGQVYPPQRVEPGVICPMCGSNLSLYMDGTLREINCPLGCVQTRSYGI